MTETALTVRQMDEMTLGKVLVESRFFSDTTQAAQAIVKVLAGREAGFGPIASMTGIYVIKGKITWAANLMAAAIKRSGRYNYRVREHSDKVCAIEFFEGKDSVGISSFTWAEAVTAKLDTSDTWKHFPKNMLFARAMSNGAKWFCPDVFGGVSVYTPEELEGASPESQYTPPAVNTNTGEIVTPQVEAPKPTNGTSKPTAPVAEGRNFYRCVQCQKGIEGYKPAKGEFVPAQTVAQKTLATYGAQLCLDCARGVKAGTIVLQPVMAQMADDDEEDETEPEEAVAI